MVSLIFNALFVASSVCLACGLHYEMMTAQPGENVTLQCSHPKRFLDKDSFMFWLRHITGRNPEFIAALNYLGSHQIIYGNNHTTVTPHITAKLIEWNFVLRINQTKLNDTAMYYCVKVLRNNPVEFNRGILLSIGGETTNLTRVNQTFGSESVHPGDSVNVQCLVLSESCTGQHSVFWFRAGEGESHPRLVYTQGDRSEECEKRAEPPSPPQSSCVYSLSKNNLSSSDSGTYYCAVATCRQILFGNGTTLDVEGKVFTGETWIFISLCIALVICVIIIAFLIYTIKRLRCDRSNTRPIQLQASVGETSPTQDEQRQDGDELLYSQIDLAKRKALSRNRRHDRNNEKDTIYSDVKHFDVIESL